VGDRRGVGENRQESIFQVKHKDDTAGEAILPKDLSRVLGEKYLSINQMAEQTELPRNQVKAITEALVEQEFLEEWLAPECPNCHFVWPEFQSEEDIEAEIQCPMCNEKTPSDMVPFYRVFKILKNPEGWPI